VKLYHIRHRETGMYYKPARYVCTYYLLKEDGKIVKINKNILDKFKIYVSYIKSNLSKNGKVYHRIPSIPKTYYTNVYHSIEEFYNIVEYNFRPKNLKKSNEDTWEVEELNV